MAHRTCSVLCTVELKCNLSVVLVVHLCYDANNKPYKAVKHKAMYGVFLSN